MSDELPKVPNFYDSQGKPVVVDSSEAANAAFMKGAIKPKRGTQVPVINHETGAVGTVDATDLEGALGSGRYSIATDEDDKQAQLATKYGKGFTALNALNQTKAALAGVGRGATFGVTDAALVEGSKLIYGDKGGDKVRQHLKELEEYNPVSSTVGEIAGIALSDILAPEAAGKDVARLAPAGERALVRGAEIGKAASRVERGGVRAVTDILKSEEKAVAKYHGPTAHAETGVPSLKQPVVENLPSGIPTGKGSAQDYAYNPLGKVPANELPTGRGLPGDYAANGPIPLNVPGVVERLRGAVPPADVSGFEQAGAKFWQGKRAEQAAADASRGVNDFKAAGPVLGAESPFKASQLGGAAPSKFGYREALQYTPAGLLSKIGRATEEATSPLLGKVGSIAARGGVEGAIFSGANELDEQILDGEPGINAQKVLAAMPSGALWGGMLGGGMGAAGAGVKKLSNLVAPKLEEASQALAWHWLTPGAKATKLAENIKANEALGLKGGVAAAGDMLINEVFPKMGKFAHPKEIQAAVEAVKAGALDELKRMRGGFAGVNIPAGDLGQKLLEVIKSYEGTAATKPIAERLAQWVNKDLAESLGIVKTEVNQKMLDRFVKREADPVARQALRDHLASLAPEDLAVAVPGSVSRVADWSKEVDMQKLLEERIALEKSGLAKYNRATDNKDVTDGFAHIARTMEDAYLESVEKMAAKSGDKATVEEILKAKHRYQTISALEKAADSTAASWDRGNIIKLRDMMAFAAGGFGPKGVALAAIEHQLMTRGPKVLAEVLDRMSKLGTMKAAIRKTDEAITGKLEGFIASQAPRRTKVRTFSRSSTNNDTSDAGFERKVSEINQLASMDAATKHEMARVYENYAPNTSGAIQATAVRAATYLSSQVPIGRNGAPLIGVKPQVTMEEKLKFLRKVNVVENPLVVLDKLTEHSLMRDEVAALQAVHPDLYKQMSMAMGMSIAAHNAKGKPISYEAQMAIATFLGHPVGNTTTPEFAQKMQENIALEGAPANPIPKGNLISSFAAANMTELDRREAGKSAYASPPQR